MQPVTCVTRDATLDDLSAQDYRDIYDELRGRDTVAGAYAISLDKFVTMVTSAYSKAQWSKYHNGETAITRTMRNELRRAVGLAPLPPTVAEATASASPDAAVWQVGEGPAEHVIMVTGVEPITLHVNGAVSVGDPAAQMPRNQSYMGQGEANRRSRQYDAIKARRAAQSARLAALGVTRDEALEAGLSALEAEANTNEKEHA